jgi:nicotinate-nucleotide--dimethylbenzimidazole phosphoribosyltransferase
MSVDGWQTVLVLGGIRSGKSEFAESLVAGSGAVRYVATGPAAREDDPEWERRLAAHRERRPVAWTVEETGDDPARLIELVTVAKPEDTVLVDDLGGWVTALLDPARQPADDLATVRDLVEAVRSAPARLVLVSPEVGLSMVPLTPLGRAFTDAVGTTNRSLADVCDAVVLVVAGQPTWLKPPPSPAPAGVPATPEPAPAAVEAPAPDPAFVDPTPAVSPAVSSPEPGPEPVAPPAVTTLDPEPVVSEDGPESGPTWSAPTMTLPALSSGLVIQPGMELPMPDEYEPAQARLRLIGLDLGGAGLGKLEEAVAFAAAVQGRTVPAPWRAPRVVLIRGDHRGGASAGVLDGESVRRAELARSGAGPIARLAAAAGASLQVVDAPDTGAMEDGPVMSADAVDSALRYGWRLAEEASDAGVDVLVLGSCGDGAEAAAAAVVSATSGAEPAAILGRVIAPGAEVDDNAWMIRCAAVRDAIHRMRRQPRGPKDILAQLGGGDIAVATGLLLGATSRRLPVMIDGPVGVAAALVTRDLAGQARHWCLLPDHGNNPTVRLAADVLGLTPMFDLRLDLGEGGTALATLPLLRNAVTLAGALTEHPALAPDADGSDDDELDELDESIEDDDDSLGRHAAPDA